MVSHNGRDHTAVKGQLIRLLRDHVAVDASLLRDDSSLFDLGIDSASMLGLTDLIRRTFGVSLSLSEAMAESGSIAELAERITVRVGTTPIVVPSPATETAVPRPDVVAPPSSLQEQLIQLIQQQRATMEHVFKLQLDVLAGALGTPGEPSAIAQSVPAAAPSAIAAASVSSSAAPRANDRANDRATSELVRALPETAARSKQLAQRYRSVWADLDEPAGFTQATKEATYQITVDRASGARFVDVDGNEYVDIAMGFGSLLLGHSPGFLMEALHAELDRGIQLAPRHRLSGEVGELIARLTGFDRVTLTATGTEAVMTTMKIARAYSGKPKIAIFSGGYHGHCDATLATRFRKDGPIVPLAPGISRAALDDMLVLEYNSESALAAVEEHADELAAVIVEPVQSRRPDIQPRQFLAQLRNATTQHGVLLAFDEVITGFRSHLGGAAALFGVRPDLAIYGKSVCNGIPVGVVAGKREIMDVCDGGAWQFGDNSYPAAPQTFFAGTFFKHPLTLAACQATLTYLEAATNSLQESLTAKTERLVARLDDVLESRRVPIRVASFASLFLFKPADGVERHHMEAFFHVMRTKGVFTWAGRTCFLSTAHTDEDLDAIVAAVADSADALVRAKVLEPTPRRDGAQHRGFQPGIPDKIYYD